MPRAQDFGRSSTQRKRLLGRFPARAAAVTVTAAALAVGTIYLVTSQRDPSGRETARGRAGATAGPGDAPPVFAHPAGWAPQDRTAADTAAGVLLRLRRFGPDATFVLRRIDARLEEPLDLRRLAGDTQVALQQSLPGVSDLGSRTLRRGTQDYLRLTYRQAGQDPAVPAYRGVLVIVPTARQTYYLTFRSAVADDAQVGPDVDRMVTGFLDAVAPG